MSLVLPATKARANFFEILNRVLYRGETVFVTKNGTDSMVKLSNVSSGRKTLKDLAGSISKEDADAMWRTIKKARSYPNRKVEPFD